MNGVSLAMNGRGLNGRYMSSESEQSESDSQGTTQHVEDWMYNSSSGGGGGGVAGGGVAAGGQGGEYRLSVIPEHVEGAENLASVVPPQQQQEGVGGSPSPPIPPPTAAMGPPFGGERGVSPLERRGMNITVPVYMHVQDSDSEVLDNCVFRSRDPLPEIKFSPPLPP